MESTKIYILVLVLTHVFAHRLKSIPLPKSVWLSFGGGISVSFVFMNLLPELQHWQIKLEGSHLGFKFLEGQLLYVLMMLGVLAFYTLEKGIIHFKERQEPEEQAVEDGVYFWHLGIFAIYNATFGYFILENQEMRALESPLVFSAVVFHFVTNDYAMQNHHEKAYQKSGRWVMGGAVMLGSLLAYFIKLEDFLMAAVFAFFTGGIIINILKEEMHEGKENNLGSFLVGAGLFSLLQVL